ncbi:MAG: dethiobiotin synthase [Hydrogenophilaceae bacterium]|nr:dethiobiotin synthase [Hydrogenophilaceae bacterium]
MKGCFVTGTDTGVGKTLVTVALIEALKQAGYRVAGMKPVAAGIDETGENEDVVRIRLAANVTAPVDTVSPYRFGLFTAPHIAASMAGVQMQIEVVADAYKWLAHRAEWVVVEGAGGFLVPFNEKQGMDAIPVHLQLPVVLVVGMRLGCLNHALLTAEAIRARGLALAGWVANCIDPDMAAFEENLQTLHASLAAPCLGVMPWLGNQAAKTLPLNSLSIDKLVNQNTQL